MTRLRPASVLGAAFVLLAAGCGSSGTADKAGGSHAPVVLDVASPYTDDEASTPKLRAFANAVARLSHGKLEIRMHFAAEGSTAPDIEERVARDVVRGDFELGWIPSRAWDELGVESFRALQAPFLITNYAVLDAVVRSSIADEMLARLESKGVVGLALAPDLLRHPAGFDRALASPRDYVGMRIRDFPSRVTDTILRALGATPVHVAPDDWDTRRFDGQEVAFSSLPLGAIVTANVAFFAKTVTLVASKRAFARLDSVQQNVLREAAREMVRSVSGYPVPAALGEEAVLARQWCGMRTGDARAALATPGELRELRAAVRPVYTSLERDSPTRRFIARIERLRASLPPDRPISLPSSCLHAPSGASSAGTPRPAGMLNGTYRWVLTKAAADAFGPPASDPGSQHPFIGAMVLRDGRWHMGGEQPETGTYRIVGNRIVFDWPRVGYKLHFTFTRDRDGTLHLSPEPVPAMDRGDQFVWSGAPWRRVGPPSPAG